MLKKIGMGIGAAVGLLFLLAVVALVWAHVAIRRERTSLPNLEQAKEAVEGPNGPTRVSYINTASQVMPRSGVLDPGKDPSPSLPYTMSHPSFVLEWPDGKILLVDAGMTRKGAEDFGANIEALGGADKIQVLTPTAEALGDARRRVKGAIFTHLHTDHVDGMPEVCRGLPAPVDVFMSEAQLERPNYTTRPGHSLMHSTECLNLEKLGGLALKKVDGFPGVFVVAAGGHTPGSQIILAGIGEGDQRRLYAFTGDTVNNVDGITYDIPKPLLYRTLIVPEDEERQHELRLWLRELHDKDGFILVPAHDQNQIERAGIPKWGS